MEWSFISLTGRPPSPRHGSSLVTYSNNKAVLFGGWTRGVSNAEIVDQYYNDVFILDLDQRQWSKIVATSSDGSFPLARAYHTACIIDSNMYVFGGGQLWAEPGPSVTFADLWKFDIVNRRWSQVMATGECPPAMEGHSSIELNGKILVFGGSDGTTTYNSLWSFDPKTGAWTIESQSGAIPLARCYHSFTRIDDHAYVFGGSHWEGYNGDIYRDFYVLDLKSFKWHEILLPKLPHPGVDGGGRLASAPSGRFGHSCNRLSSNQLFIYGGWSIVDSDKSEFFADGYIYDPVRGHWSRLSPELEQQGPGVLYGHIGVRNGPNLVFFGGRDQTTSKNEVFVLKELNGNLEIPKSNSSLGADLLQGLQQLGASAGAQAHGACDIRLKLSSGDIIMAHRFVLMSRSPKFRAMFSSGMSESQLSEISINNNDFHSNHLKPSSSNTLESSSSLPSTEKSAESDFETAFHVFVEFLYSGNLDFDNDPRLKDSDIILHLLQFSDQYLVPDLKEQIEYALQFSLSADNAAFLWDFSARFSAHRLRAACLSYIVGHYDNCINSEYWLMLSAELKQEVEANLQTRFRRRRAAPGAAGVDSNASLGSQRGPEDPPQTKKRKI